MNEKVPPNYQNDAAKQQDRPTKHPKTSKPPYYHRDTKTHQEEVGRFGHRILLRPVAYVFRFADAHNGFITGVATLILAYLTYSLAYDSTIQAGNAAHQLEIMQLDERPWIGIQGLPEPIVPFLQISKGIYLTAMKLTIKNLGKSPAIMVNVYGRLITQNIAAVEGLYRSVAKICDPLRQERPLPAGVERVQFTMFPGDSYSPSIDLSNLDNMADPRILDDTSFIAIGCIDYKFVNRGEHHQTVFIYDLTGANGLPTSPEVGRSVPISDLRYSFDLGGNGPAD